MLDPSAWAMVSLTFVGAQVAQKAADGAIQAVWDRFSARFLARFDRSPTPEDATDAEQVLADDSTLAADIDDVLRDSGVLRRAKLVSEAIRGARLLWVDDTPQNNDWERVMLRQLGVHVTAVTRTETALDCLRAEPFDLVISDITRTEVRDEGLRALPEIRRVAPSTAVIFCFGSLDPDRAVPTGTSRITNRPDELLHLVMDVLERNRL